MRRYLLLSVAGCHLLVTLLYNVVSCSDQLRVVYGDADDDASATAPVWSALRWLDGLRLIRAYGHYSGMGTGYGFFAPQVGSVYYLRIDLYDHTGRLLESVFDPGLKRAASKLRYAGFLHTFQSLLPAPYRVPGTTALQQRTARAIARSISERYARRSPIPDIARIRFDVFVHHHPSLRDAAGHNRGMLIPLYGQDIPYTQPS